MGGWTWNLDGYEDDESDDSRVGGWARDLDGYEDDGSYCMPAGGWTWTRDGYEDDGSYCMPVGGSTWYLDGDEDDECDDTWSIHGYGNEWVPPPPRLRRASWNLDGSYEDE